MSRLVDPANFGDYDKKEGCLNESLDVRARFHDVRICLRFILQVSILSCIRCLSVTGVKLFHYHNHRNIMKFCAGEDRETCNQGPLQVLVADKNTKSCRLRT